MMRMTATVVPLAGLMSRAHVYAQSGTDPAI
jgi:hypothetical protein